MSARKAGAICRRPVGPQCQPVVAAAPVTCIAAAVASGGHWVKGAQDFTVFATSFIYYSFKVKRFKK